MFKDKVAVIKGGAHSIGNVDDYTYFKLRDIAEAVGGFEVDFKDDTIVLTSENDKADTEALSIAKQGIFSSGGTVTEPLEGEYDPTTNWLDPTLAGTTAHVDHANVQYQIPTNETGLPMVFLHGYGQSRMGWMTTPDGREGWSDMFLKDGHSVFLVDQPRRGEAGATASMTTDITDTWSEDSKDYKPGEQAWYTHFRIGRVAPGGTPEIGSDWYKKFIDAKIPMIIYFGDYIDNGPEDIQSTTFWKTIRDGAVAFAEQYNKDGGNATVITLPEIGITGNSHFMFQETNNKEIADHIENWIKENVK